MREWVTGGVREPLFKSLRHSGAMSTEAPATDSLVPIWPALVIPVLSALQSGELLHRKEVVDRAAAIAGLSTQARDETLKTGGFRYEQRIGWAISHLSKAGWIDRPARAVYQINEHGHRALADNPSGFDYASARETFAPFWPKPAMKASSATALPNEDAAQVTDVLDPMEQIEDAIARIEADVADELLWRLRESHPDFLEQAVVSLLLAMGYGGAEQRGRRIGGSGDGGVDGVIDQDALGLDRVYVQAKRYKEGSNIGRETIQAFVGALHGFGASRGVFLTTSAFTPGATAYAAQVQSRIILIDGERLVSLMIKYKVGVQVRQQFFAVEIDGDFFE